MIRAGGGAEPEGGIVGLLFLFHEEKGRQKCVIAGEFVVFERWNLF